MTQAFIVGTTLFLLIIAACFIFTDEALHVLGCSDQLSPYATDYLLWLLPGLPFLLIECCGMMLVRLDGAPKTAMTIQIVAASANILLDWIFVYPLDMGVKGAAIATSISCAIAALPILVYFGGFSNHLKYHRLKCSWKSLFLTLRNTGYIIKIGFATFVAEMAMGVMIVTGNYMFMERLGENGVAAYSIGCYLFPIIFSITNAVAQSAQPIISFNYGAGNRDRVRRTLKIAVSTGIICGVVVSTIMAFAAPLLCGIFLPSETVAFGLAANGLPFLGTCAVFFALNITFIGYYQSIEQSLRSTVYMLMRGIIFLVPSFLILPDMVGDDGLWLAIPAAECLTFIFIIIAYLTLRVKSATVSGVRS